MERVAGTQSDCVLFNTDRTRIHLCIRRQKPKAPLSPVQRLGSVSTFPSHTHTSLKAAVTEKPKELVEEKKRKDLECKLGQISTSSTLLSSSE